MRAFICAELGKEAGEELGRIMEEIKKLNLIKAKYVKKDLAHLTLKFLGEISDFQANRVKEKLKQLKFKKIKAKLGKLGVFSPRYVRVLWVSLEPAEKFKELQEGVERVLGELFQREKREFSSHVTLARVKQVKDRKEFINKISKIEVKPVNFLVDEIKLKKSTLTRDGPIYQDIGEFKLE